MLVSVIYYPCTMLSPVPWMGFDQSASKALNKYTNKIVMCIIKPFTDQFKFRSVERYRAEEVQQISGTETKATKVCAGNLCSCWHFACVLCILDFLMSA